MPRAENNYSSPELIPSRPDVLSPTVSFILLAASAMLLRIATAPWMGYGPDMGSFMAWGFQLADVGPGAFWTKGYWCDYLPGYLYVLWGVAKVASGLPEPLQVLLFKLPNLLADVATAYLIWRAVRPTPADRKLWIPAIYLFSPAIFANSTLWGQVDSFHTLCIVGVIVLLSRRPEWAAALLGYALSVKPHTVVILPLITLYAITLRVRWYRIVLCAALVVAVFAATFLPFANWSISDLPHLITTRVDKTMGQYGNATVNAYNFWYLLGENWHRDSTKSFGPITIRQAGTMLCLIGYAFSLVWYWRRRSHRVAVWESAALIYLVTFLFVTRAHERHLFPFFAMMTVVAGMRTPALRPLAILTVTYCVNLGMSWYYLVHNSAQLGPPWFDASVCIINLLALPVTILSFTRFSLPWSWRSLLPAPDETESPAETVLPPDRPWLVENRKLLLVLIGLFALTTRVARLNAPPERYFDEVYHAYTAEQWAKGNTKAWLWGQKVPDKGNSYEWTHPPLAKLAMQASIEIFGDHPWAWRLPAALAGTICVLLIYWIARTLFGCESVAMLAAALASLDTLPLVMSRIGMNDEYCVMFILIAFLAALGDRYVIAAIAVGLALACKWTALYALPLMAVIHLWRVEFRQRLAPERLFLIALAYGLAVPILYVGSYTPFFLAGNSPSDFIELQKQMWLYHTHLEATHPFSSPAYQWPFDNKAVWLYTHDFPEPSDDAEPQTSTTETQPTSPTRYVANVWAVGNPVIWLPGVAAVIFAAMHFVQRREDRLLPLLAAYLVFWAPWLLSPRIMFIYHYLPSLPFLYVILAWAVVAANVRRVAKLLLGLAGLAFLLMYPYVTAIPMPVYLTPGHFKLW